MSPVADGKVRRRLQQQHEIVLEQGRHGRQMLAGKQVWHSKEILGQKSLARMREEYWQVQTGLYVSEMLSKSRCVSAGMHLSEMLEEGGVFVGPEQGGLSDDAEKDGRVGKGIKVFSRHI